ncbi:hypothetical protein AMTRI_Chr04g179740 [Amborella trichopoda]
MDGVSFSISLSFPPSSIPCPLLLPTAQNLHLYRSTPMGRSPCCSKLGLNKGPWTPEEDFLLINYINAHGEGGWTNLPKKAGLLRCGKSCRLRWMNYLRPDVKRGYILPEEEDLILRLHRLLGNRWSLIAGRIPGRTDNEIKNYWNTHLSKLLISQGIDPRTHKPLAPESLTPPPPLPRTTPKDPSFSRPTLLHQAHDFKPLFQEQIFTNPSHQKPSFFSYNNKENYNSHSQLPFELFPFPHQPYPLKKEVEEVEFGAAPIMAIGNLSTMDFGALKNEVGELKYPMMSTTQMPTYVFHDHLTLFPTASIEDQNDQKQVLISFANQNPLEPSLMEGSSMGLLHSNPTMQFGSSISTGFDLQPILTPMAYSSGQVSEIACSSMDHFAGLCHQQQQQQFQPQQHQELQVQAPEDRHKACDIQVHYDLHNNGPLIQGVDGAFPVIIPPPDHFLLNPVNGEDCTSNLATNGTGWPNFIGDAALLSYVHDMPPPLSSFQASVQEL